MPRKPISEETIQNVIKDYNDGMFVHDIAKKYHIDFNSLKKKLIAENRITDREVELTYEQLVDVSIRYRNGERLKDLAKEYNIGIAKLTARLKSNSLYFKKYDFIGDDELAIYIKEYNNGNGLTPKELSVKYNRGDTSIINALTKAGVYIQKKSYWTQEEIDILKKYYPIEKISDVMKRLPNHSNKQAIHTKASELNIVSYYKLSNTWTDDEIRILKEKYNKISSNELYEIFNHRHTQKAIRSKAKKLKLVDNPFWTDAEKEIVKNNYSNMSMNELLLLLPNKTNNAIVGMAKKLGVKSKYYLEEKYTEEQRQFIIENWQKLNDIEIADILGKTPAGIKEQRTRLGLYKINKEYTKYESVSKFFRGHLQEWKNESLKSCDYKCILTGSKDFAIHHLYGFNFIVKEVFEILDKEGFLTSEKIEDYTKDELDYMLSIFTKIHSKYPLGVCVRKDLHDLFHVIYGSGGNTEEQWNQFCINYNNGLYDEQIA